MTNTSVAVDLCQHLDVHCRVTAKITFYHVVCGNFLTKSLDLIICEVSATSIRINACSLENLLGRCTGTAYRNT